MSRAWDPWASSRTLLFNSWRRSPSFFFFFCLWNEACTDSLPLIVLCTVFWCSGILQSSFWECSFAQAIWLQAPCWNSFNFPLHIQSMDIIDAAIHKLISPEFEILRVACWMIWNRRNKLIFENKIPCSDGLWSRALVYTMEFMEVNKIGSTIPRAPDKKWFPPPSYSQSSN